MHPTDRLESSVVDEIAEVFKKHRKKTTQKQFSKRLTLLLIITILLTLPLMLVQAREDQPEIEKLRYYRINKLTLEYPADVQPELIIRPATTGCSHFGFLKESRVVINGWNDQEIGMDEAM